MTTMTNKRVRGEEIPAEIAAAWRVDASRRAERPEEFWQRQQVQIRQRIENRSTLTPRSFWMTVATAAFLFFAVLLIAPAGPPPQLKPSQARVDADQELLLAVERTLAAGTPEALEPVTLMVESSSKNNDVENISHKEHGHEN
jgi:hypothetical protein